jgi:hypothetical protein
MENALTDSPTIDRGWNGQYFFSCKVCSYGHPSCPVDSERGSASSKPLYRYLEIISARIYSIREWDRPGKSFVSAFPYSGYPFLSTVAFDYQVHL